MSADKKTVAQKFIKNPNDVVAMSRKRMQAMEMIATKIIAPEDAKHKKNAAIFKEILAQELNPHESRNISKKEMLADDEIFVCENNDKISLGRMKKMAQFMDHLNKRHDVEEQASLNSNEDSVDSHSSTSSGNSDRKLKKSAKAIGSVENLIENAMSLLKHRTSKNDNKGDSTLSEGNRERKESKIPVLQKRKSSVDSKVKEVAEKQQSRKQENDLLRTTLVNIAEDLKNERQDVKESRDEDVSHSFSSFDRKWKSENTFQETDEEDHQTGETEEEDNAEEDDKDKEVGSLEEDDKDKEVGSLEEDDKDKEVGSSEEDDNDEADDKDEEEDKDEEVIINKDTEKDTTSKDNMDSYFHDSGMATRTSADTNIVRKENILAEICSISTQGSAKVPTKDVQRVPINDFKKYMIMPRVNRSTNHEETNRKPMIRIPLPKVDVCFSDICVRNAT